MAQRTLVITLCDRHAQDGEEVEAAANVIVPVGNRQAELDLCQSHLDEFHAALAPWAEIATPVRPAGAAATRRKGAGSSSNGAQPDTAAIREWAARRGIDVKARGRIPAAVVEQYRSEVG